MMGRTALRAAKRHRGDTPTARPVVLLTGASSGLGLAIAKALRRDGGFSLVLTSRAASLGRFDAAGITNGPFLRIRALDVTDHAQIRAVIDEITTTLGGVDVLINNAGSAASSTVEDGSDSTRQALLDVNYLAPVELMSQVLPSMRAKQRGRIINISSAGGFMAMPTMSGYSASKFALEAASEALWYEMKPWGIRITLVIPGFINSDAYERTTETPRSRLGSRDAKSPYYAHYRGMRRAIERTMHLVAATNEGIAQRVVHITRMRRPPLRVHITCAAAVLYWIRKLMPPRLYHALAYRLLPGVRGWGPR